MSYFYYVSYYFGKNSNELSEDLFFCPPSARVPLLLRIVAILRAFSSLASLLFAIIRYSRTKRYELRPYFV